MALPIIKTFQDCGDFSKTVSPYIGQLSALPQHILESISDPSALNQVYVDTNPLITAFAFSLLLVPIFLIVSEANKNYSQVDRCWSILPTIYNAHFSAYAHAVGLPTKRIDTVLTCSAVWSVRLTFNYFRKGGYSVGSEDYRWEVLRKYINKPLFFIFNVLFICLAQSLLLFLITTPSYVLLLTERLPSPDPDPFDTVDSVFSGVLVSLVIFEWFADQQQWTYQTAKVNFKKTAKLTQGYSADDLDRGFIVNGLWSWSRHPNFAAEQAVWISLYQWSCFSTNTYFNWTAVGAAGYLGLFAASTWFTEMITAEKYPDYREYQARVGKFLPRMSTEAIGWDEDERKRGGNGDVKEGRRVTRSMGKGNQAA